MGNRMKITVIATGFDGENRSASAGVAVKKCSDQLPNSPGWDE
jgi:hypothetical protein